MVFLKNKNKKDNWILLVLAKGWQWAERITVMLGVIAAVTIIVLMILTTIDVVLRYILSNPLKGAYEISEILFLSAVFLGMGYTQLFREHVNVEILISHISRRVTLILETAMLLLALVIYGLLAWKGTERFLEAIISGEYRWGLIHIPLWPARLMVPLGASILCLRFIGEMVINLHKFFNKRKGEY